MNRLHRQQSVRAVNRVQVQEIPSRITHLAGPMLAQCRIQPMRLAVTLNPRATARPRRLRPVQAPPLTHTPLSRRSAARWVLVKGICQMMISASYWPGG